MLRNPAGVAFAVVFLLCGVIVADLNGMYAAHGLLVAARDFGADLSGLELVAASAATANGFQGLAFLVTGIVFLFWFRRLRANAEVWAGDLMRRSPGWAVGGWIIPVGNLWIPRGVAADIWRASRPDPSATDRRGEFLLMNCWWVLFLVDKVFASMVSEDLEEAETATRYVSVAKSLLISGGIDIVAAVLAILLVRRMTAMQETKAASVVVPADSVVQ